MIYEVTKKPSENSIVKPLNATVLTATFKSKDGIQKGDLYTYEGTQCKCPKEIVAHGTCAPIMGIFVETIDLTFINI